MRRLFVIVLALILYGSLYPWLFHPAGPMWLAVLRVFHEWPPVLHFFILKDMALNVVVYVPLGLTGYLSGAPGFRWTRASWPILFGFLLSLGVESAQSYLPRSPSAMDLLCNTIGAALGVAIGAAYESALSKWFERLNRSAMRPSSALMMLIVFAGHYVMPLSTNLIKLFTVHHQPTIDIQPFWQDFGNSFAGWLFASRFTEAVAGKHRWAVPVLCGSLTLATITRLISPNLLFTWPMLAGAAAGIGLWKLLEGRGLEKTYAAFAFAWIVGDGLRPYAFTDHKPFDWIPFLGLLGEDWTGAITSLLLKTWMYGSAFWAWEHAGLSRPRALAFLLTILALIEYAQMYLPGRVSTMTDIAMGAIVAGLLWAVERKYGS